MCRPQMRDTHLCTSFNTWTAAPEEQSVAEPECILDAMNPQSTRGECGILEYFDCLTLN